MVEYHAAGAGGALIDRSDIFFHFHFSCDPIVVIIINDLHRIANKFLLIE